MIKLENIEVTYGLGTDTEIRALCIPSLEVGSGCWCNVIGPNGSGKTTLLKVLSGGIDSFCGSVFIEGRNVTRWKARQLSSSVQLLEQSPERNTIPSMTIEENLRLYSQNGRFPSFSFLGKGSSDRIKQLLSRFEMGLQKRLSSQVGLLSGGRSRRWLWPLFFFALPKCSSWMSSSRQSIPRLARSYSPSLEKPHLNRGLWFCKNGVWCKR